MKNWAFLIVLLAAFSTCAQANLSLYGSGTGCPSGDCITNTAPSGLGDLVHGNFYIWKMTSLLIPSGQSITTASLTFYNINDWMVEDGDKLYIRLMDGSDIGTPSTSGATHDLGMWNLSGVPVYKGNDTLPAADDLGSYGHQLTIYEDKNEYWDSHRNKWVNPPETFIWNFTSEQISWLNSYVADDGVIGIGLDPDCYYRIPETTDCGIKFKYCIEPIPTIPAPGAIFLGSIGVCLVGWLRRTRTL